MTRKQAVAARDAGIAQAVQHAEEDSPNWAAEAYGVLEDYLTRGDVAGGRQFTSENVREHARILELPVPPHLRSWGGIFQKAARAGLIVKVGIVESKAPHCHCAQVGLWKRA